MTHKVTWEIVIYLFFSENSSVSDQSFLEMKHFEEKKGTPA